MKLYTIGFTQKSAEAFFTLLKEAGVTRILDIRLHNSSQLAGFAKSPDLAYLSKAILGIEVIHDPRFAPTEDLMKAMQGRQLTIDEYARQFRQLMQERQIHQVIREFYGDKLDGLCLLCSEAGPKFCHRSLVADLIRESMPELDIRIRHLI